jgi:Fuc2NAc and GlcNAc transferase
LCCALCGSDEIVFHRGRSFSVTVEYCIKYYNKPSGAAGNMYDWLLTILSFALSWFLSGLALRYALAKQMLDVPNTRSSHTFPTPRGGGIGFVVAFVCSLALLAAVGRLEISSFIALVGGGSGVAILGFVDDHVHLSARWRLIGHFVFAGFALLWLGGLPPLSILGSIAELGWFAWIAGLIYLVWMLNLFNFMDGIDGLASIQTISVCLGMCLIFSLVEAENLIAMPLLLAVTVSGFLLWNFPPAKIFMGDVGSGFLGLIVGLLSIITAWSKPELIYCWAILLGVFIVDATFTLARRILRGEKFYEAHRSHAYQHAAGIYGHKAVSLAVLAINLLFLLPVAILVALGKCSPIAGLMISFLPLGVLAYYFCAGKSA